MKSREHRYDQAEQAIVIIVQKGKQLKLLCELTRVRMYMCKVAFVIHHRDIKWTFKAEIMSGLSLE